MAYEHKALRHKNDPAWIRGIEKYVEKAGQADVDDTIRNYGGSKEVTEDAALDLEREKK
mgnify:CR=1 FL=1